MKPGLPEKLQLVRSLVAAMGATTVDHFADMSALFDSFAKLASEPSTKRLADIAIFSCDDDAAAFDGAIKEILEALDAAIQHVEDSAL